jgi:hypothetical protein
LVFQSWFGHTKTVMWVCVCVRERVYMCVSACARVCVTVLLSHVVWFFFICCEINHMLSTKFIYVI